ncbi:MAG: ribosomal L7Ae/L30e/S12e/Gadd45 family protein [DPANN group archaeon]|nr:ribosomal L7Ae/L30e/S12e/Gadd45 family protein [DPANN group archaeon]
MTEKNVDAVIKTALTTDKLLIGTNKVLKAVKLGKAEIVVLASNCSDLIRNDIMSSAKLSGVEIINYEKNARNLGAICKKEFTVVSVCTLK